MMKSDIPTSVGVFTAWYSDIGLALLKFPAPRPRSCRTSPDLSTSEPHALHTITINAVLSVLEGRAIREMPPLDLSQGTAFRQKVWNAMLTLDLGKTCSYSELAQMIDQPKAVRAVGGACGANPIPLLVPCHRVLAKGKKLGGFSGGLDWKRFLLQRESCER